MDSYLFSRVKIRLKSSRNNKSQEICTTGYRNCI
jgi:hypothetical protein